MNRVVGLVLCLVGFIAAGQTPDAGTDGGTDGGTDAGTEVQDAGPPTVESVLSQGFPDASISLGRTLIVKLKPGTLKPLLDEAAAQKKDFGLYLDGWYFKGLGRPAASNLDEVRFVLDRTPENKDAWTRVFTSASLSHDTSVTVSVGVANGTVAASDVRVVLDKFPGHAWIVGLFMGVFLFGLIIYVGGWTPALRDAGLRADKDDLGAFSLGRVQMAWWTVWILFAFIFLWTVTGEAEPLTTSLLALMGLGAGTSLGAASIDDNKRSKARAAVQELADALDRRVAELATLLTVNAGEAARLDAAEAATKEAEKALKLARMKKPEVSAEIAQAEAELVKAADAWKPLRESAFGLAKANAELQVKAAREAIALNGRMLSTKNHTFLQDLFQDANGWAFHRVQMAIWTVVLTAVFVFATISKLAMPELDPVLLGLVGISSGTYLGFKVPEKP